MLETRDPGVRGWTQWKPDATCRDEHVDRIGTADHCDDVNGRQIGLWSDEYSVALAQPRRRPRSRPQAPRCRSGTPPRSRPTRTAPGSPSSASARRPRATCVLLARRSEDRRRQKADDATPAEPVRRPIRRPRPRQGAREKRSRSCGRTRSRYSSGLWAIKERTSGRTGTTASPRRRTSSSASATSRFAARAPRRRGGSRCG